MMRTVLASTLIYSLSLTVPAQAQERPAPADTLPEYVLEGVTVTATRAAADRHDLPQRVEVVTRTDLELTPGRDLADALKENVGVDIIQYPALLSGISIRGFRPQFSGINQRTLVLLDGRPAGMTNLATLDLAVAERVEVLKGPASALYGSNAMAGVVNIVTRRSEGPPSGRVAAEYGTFGTYGAEAAFGGNASPALDFDLVLAAAGRADGYRIGASRPSAADSVTKILADGGTMRLPELAVDSTIAFSEHATRSGNARVGYAFSERWRLEGRGDFFAADGVENPGDLLATFYDPRTVNDISRGSAELGFHGGPAGHEITVRAFGAREQTTYYHQPVGTGDVSLRMPARWLGAQVQDAASLGRHSITAGVDLLDVSTDSERFSSEGDPVAPYTPGSSTRSAAAFAEARLRLAGDRLVTTLGGRLDRIDFRVQEGEIWDFAASGTAAVQPNVETHTIFNPSFGVLYRPGAGLRLHASGGRAFVAPDAFYVAGYAEARAAERRAVRITQGNPDLVPERSRSWDVGAGIVRPRAGFEADLTYFQTDVSNRVVQRAVVPDGVQLTPAGDTILGIVTYANSDAAEIRGLEGTASFDLGAVLERAYSLRLFVNGTRILRAEEIAAEATQDIRNVADLTVVGGLHYDDARLLSGRISGRYVGTRLDQDFSDWMNPGDVRYPSFLVVDAAAHLRLRERYRLSLSVDNLTDRNYYEVRGYNMPGRTIRLGIAAEL